MAFASRLFDDDEAVAGVIGRLQRGGSLDGLLGWRVQRVDVGVIALSPGHELQAGTLVQKLTISVTSVYLVQEGGPQTYEAGIASDHTGLRRVDVLPRRMMTCRDQGSSVYETLQD